MLAKSRIEHRGQTAKIDVRQKLATGIVIRGGEPSNDAAAGIRLGALCHFLVLVFA
jgi:hypothetical protein